MTVRKEPYEVTKWGTKYRYAMAPSNVAGWRKRLARGMVDAAERLEGMGREKSMEYLCSFKGIDVKIAKMVYETLFRQTKGERGIDKLRDGRIDIFPNDRILKLFRQTFLQVSLDLGKRETDEPVTSDIKRLIRMVSSLHGKTGLRVVRLTRDQLDDFLPLRDAVPSTFRDDPVKIQVGRVANVTLRGETFNLSEGLTEVPEYVAVFLACRGWATIPQV
jgi:DNA primase small subunit